MSEVQFMADLESVILRGAWPGMVGMVALDGCKKCSSILDCRRAVEVSLSAHVQGGRDVRASDMFCDECFDKHILPLVESGEIRASVSRNLGHPLWAPPPDPDTLPLPGILSEEQPKGSVRVTVEVTDGREVMGPEEEDNEPVPYPKEYVTWGGEEFPVPSMGELERWVFDGDCEALDGCIVEGDGHCCHGAPSWLIQLGMI